MEDIHGLIMAVSLPVKHCTIHAILRGSILIHIVLDSVKLIHSSPGIWKCPYT